MKYEDISPLMRKYLASFWALRQLGFKAEEIFCQIAKDGRNGKLSLFASLLTQGKTFNIIVGPLSEGEDGIPKVQAEYDRMSDVIRRKEISESEMNRVYQDSDIVKDPASFILALIENGFVLPASGLSVEDLHNLHPQDAEELGLLSAKKRKLDS